MDAPGTIGIRLSPYAMPAFFSSRYRRTPSPLERPNRLPPERAMPWICSAIFVGFSRSVSRVAGAAPRTSTPAVAPPSINTTVQPVGRAVRVWWPTLMPGTAVRVAFCAAAGVDACTTPPIVWSAPTSRQRRFGEPGRSSPELRTGSPERLALQSWPGVG